VSVLLDAGAGPRWRFHERESGQAFARSEGLAVASLRAFMAGRFSSDAGDPLRVDAKALAALDPRKSQVVELRYFGGLSVQETAEVLQVSPETIMRDWKFAKLWLLRQLTSS